MVCVASAVISTLPAPALAAESATKAVTSPPIWLLVSETPTPTPPAPPATATPTTVAVISEASLALTVSTLPADTADPPLIEASVN